ncbi:MAG: 30S ribosome-binding factor RbfA [Longimicrobiales bacterium]|nr:30S ribosome-binding factor RbfA [Longimicrobiales bacterium]
MSRRVDRLGAQLRRELAGLLLTRVKDPRVSGVTLTHVRVDRDLTHARVFVRVTGSEGERERALEGLAAAAPFLRRELGAALKIRRAPELVFQQDETLDHALRIETLLDEVRPVQGWGEAGEGEDAEPGTDTDTDTDTGDDDRGDG